MAGGTRTRGGAGASGGEAAPRERILDAAYRLFSRHGVHAIGVDRVVAEAGVAKATLYHHFPSKDELAIAFLWLREQRWTRGWLQAEADRAPPPERALAVFDLFDEWFHRPDFEGCSFVKVLLETAGTRGPVHDAARVRLATVGELIAGYVAEAGAAEPARSGPLVHTILIGAIVAAHGGDADAARRARPFAAATIAPGR